MGQRHQVYMIAKVGRGSKKRYRCVAGIHWQWLYGQGPALAATRFINAVKNPLNRRLILADLESFDRYKARVRYVAVPCPYISILYQRSTNIDGKFSPECSIQDSDIGSDGGNNNDGITVIDVTNPSSPRYCMVSVGGIEAEREPQGHYMPLTAKEYVECYYPFINPELVDEGDERQRDEDQVAMIRTAYEALLDVPLIDMDTLAEAWPQEYHRIKRDRHNNTTEIKVPSLTALATIKSLQNILQSEDSADQIDFLLHLPTSTDSVTAVLKSLAAESTLSDCILPVLAKFLAPLPSDRFLDLSSFAFSGPQLTQIMKLLPTCRILKLGGRMNVEVDDIVQGTKLLPDLTTILLFDRLISLEQLKALRKEIPPSQIQIAHRQEYFNMVK